MSNEKLNRGSVLNKILSLVGFVSLIDYLKEIYNVTDIYVLFIVIWLTAFVILDILDRFNKVRDDKRVLQFERYIVYVFPVAAVAGAIIFIELTVNFVQISSLSSLTLFSFFSFFVLIAYLILKKEEAFSIEEEQKLIEQGFNPHIVNLAKYISDNEVPDEFLENYNYIKQGKMGIGRNLSDRKKAQIEDILDSIYKGIILETVVIITVLSHIFILALVFSVFISTKYFEINLFISMISLFLLVFTSFVFTVEAIKYCKIVSQDILENPILLKINMLTFSYSLSLIFLVTDVINFWYSFIALLFFFSIGVFLNYLCKASTEAIRLILLEASITKMDEFYKKKNLDKIKSVKKEIEDKKGYTGVKFYYIVFSKLRKILKNYTN